MGPRKGTHFATQARGRVLRPCRGGAIAGLWIEPAEPNRGGFRALRKERLTTQLPERCSGGGGLAHATTNPRCLAVKTYGNLREYASLECPDPYDP